MPMAEPVELDPATAQSAEPTASVPSSPVVTDPLQATSETEVTQESASSETSVHKHQDTIASEEISRQADEILARLNRANQPAEIVEEEQILADIQAQQREVTDSKLLEEIEQPQATMPIPTPAPHQDDSAMLVVNPEASSNEQESEPETFPMTDSPISSGRASRMDYEQLFDRLRNLPEGDET